MNWGFLIVGLASLFLGNRGLAENSESANSSLQQVSLQLCAASSTDESKKPCLIIVANKATSSTFQNTLHLKDPRVTGLNFDQKVISSALIDLSQGMIFLREWQKNSYAGEWTINMDTLNTQYFPVSRIHRTH